MRVHEIIKTTICDYGMGRKNFAIYLHKDLYEEYCKETGVPSDESDIQKYQYDDIEIDVISGGNYVDKSNTLYMIPTEQKNSYKHYPYINPIEPSKEDRKPTLPPIHQF